MKKLSCIIILLFLQSVAFACPVCEKNQPKFLKGISHGTGPQSNWDYVIVWATVIVVLITLFYTIKWLIKPGEKDETHIKRMVIN
ncbi:hypothetical protein [Arcticibacter eurypsychrophilus]|uniref:hypothetical protein n=1 Tax=Arcticibacter eurypsychrophilus TaxID=1434752 RepID=UPI001112DE17|nr:hypothetical protein [Arcticibacter eurypsychrophilus]